MPDVLFGDGVLCNERRRLSCTPARGRMSCGRLMISGFIIVELARNQLAGQQEYLFVDIYMPCSSSIFGTTFVQDQSVKGKSA